MPTLHRRRRTVAIGRLPFLLVSLLLGGVGSESAAADAVSAQAPPTFRDCVDCPEMVRLPGGPIAVGSPVSEDGRDRDEGPMQRVIVPPFAIGRTEVTVAQYGRFVESTGHAGGRCYVDRARGGDNWGWAADASWADPYFDQGPDHPVTCVNQSDAEAYTDWLSERTGARYRLPSESEWAYAARAGTQESLPFDPNNGAICAHANTADRSARRLYAHWQTADCRDGHVFTAPVGSFRPNRFGLYDSLGNVWEWVADCYHDDLAGLPTDGSPWRQPACRQAVLRGTSWLDRPAYVRLANRIEDRHRGSIFGFRVARQLPATRP